MIGGPAPTVGNGTLPQSLELKLQSGIAPGWLAFGSVRWTDWSVLDTLDYTIFVAPQPIGGAKELEYYYKDGWTVTGGIGHVFSETISGVVGFTWDRGVSTTEDTLSDSYTAAAGVSIKDKLGGEVRFGGAISYLTSASVSAETQPQLPGVVDPGASFGYSVGGDWVYALSAGYKIQW
jgi:long-chain fatty acid transport protein